MDKPTTCHVEILRPPNWASVVKLMAYGPDVTIGIWVDTENLRRETAWLHPSEGLPKTTPSTQNT